MNYSRWTQITKKANAALELNTVLIWLCGLCKIAVTHFAFDVDGSSSSLYSINEAHLNVTVGPSHYYFSFASRYMRERAYAGKRADIKVSRVWRSCVCVREKRERPKPKV